jgi:1,4-dihydroxy-2-naphthoyl-CoA hydrolase
VDHSSPDVNEASQTTIAKMNQMGAGTLGDTLGIELLQATPDCVRAKMPVTRALHQPFGVLHGGASLALAETVASIGGWLNVNQSTEIAVGLELNANHLRAVREGWVMAEATPLHRGRTTQVWQVHITDAQGRLVCVSRCTLAVAPRPTG